MEKDGNIWKILDQIVRLEDRTPTVLGAFP